jgi:hypothetical protein
VAKGIEETLLAYWYGYRKLQILIRVAGEHTDSSGLSLVYSHKAGMVLRAASFQEFSEMPKRIKLCGNNDL